MHVGRLVRAQEHTFFGLWLAFQPSIYTFFFTSFTGFLTTFIVVITYFNNSTYKYPSKLLHFLTPSHILSSSLSPPIYLHLFLVFVFFTFWGKKRPIEGWKEAGLGVRRDQSTGGTTSWTLLDSSNPKVGLILPKICLFYSIEVDLENSNK